MLFTKFFFLFFIFFIFYFFYILCFSFFFSVSLNYFNFFNYMDNYDFIFSFDTTSLLFTFMVLFVTSLVCLYSDFYMEHYNNKKFFFLLLLFFSSMIILSFSGSFLVLMLGWDGLGISSICLIMFYPNKITLYNSLMTMFFNRLGDVLLILSMGIVLSNYYNMFFLSGLNMLSCMSLVICSFSKSAQFPLSCWLPAAMSAPTPISAMVHSSTLVTAGLYLIQKLIIYLSYFSMLDLIVLFSCLTFLLGGLMANLELDFKKVIAFSTMSQISMIMFFISLNYISLAFTHMFFHAFFKTLLFCCAGWFFISIYNDQHKDLIKFNYSEELISALLFFSLFSMSGLLFSSSFFTKDLILENFLSYHHSFVQFFLKFGSVLTLFYCCKLSCSLFSWGNKNSYFFYKNGSFHFLIFFSVMTLIMGKFFFNFLLMEMFPLVSFYDLIFLNLIFFSSLSISYFNLMFKNFLFLSFSVSFMSFFSFTLFSNFFKNNYVLETLNSDNLFFKKKYLPFYKISIFSNLVWYKIYSVMLLMLFFFLI